MLEFKPKEEINRKRAKGNVLMFKGARILIALASPVAKVLVKQTVVLIGPVFFLSSSPDDICCESENNRS